MSISPFHPLIWGTITFIMGIPIVYLMSEERQWRSAIGRAFLIAFGITIAATIGHFYP
jgi:fucose permease